MICSGLYQEKCVRKKLTPELTPSPKIHEKQQTAERDKLRQEETVAKAPLLLSASVTDDAERARKSEAYRLPDFVHISCTSARKIVKEAQKRREVPAQKSNKISACRSLSKRISRI